MKRPRRPGMTALWCPSPPWPSHTNAHIPLARPPSRGFLRTPDQREYEITESHELAGHLVRARRARRLQCDGVEAHVRRRCLARTNERIVAAVIDTAAVRRSRRRPTAAGEQEYADYREYTAHVIGDRPRRAARRSGRSAEPIAEARSQNIAVDEVAGNFQVAPNAVDVSSVAEGAVVESSIPAFSTLTASQIGSPTPGTRGASGRGAT